MNDPDTHYWAIVPAAGIGSRFGGDIPKQYARINGRTVLEHSIYPLLQMQSIKKIVIAVAPDDHHAQQLPLLKDKRISFISGGKTRVESVLNALAFIIPYAMPSDWVIVHDSVRPCLSSGELQGLIKSLENAEHGALLAIPVTDTLKKAQDDIVLSTIDRSDIWRAQTPQAFRLAMLKDAIVSSLHDISNITDESSSIEKSGFRPLIVKGMESNIKITYPEDLALATFYLTQNSATNAQNIQKDS